MNLPQWRRWWKTQGSSQLRHLLMTEWDPVQVRDEKAAQDEYDDYVGQLGALLHKNGDVQSVADYLASAERRMGFATEPSALLNVAGHITTWYANAARSDSPG